MRKSVVLPTPMLPALAIQALWGIEILISSKISTGPKERPTFNPVNNDIAEKIYQSISALTFSLYLILKLLWYFYPFHRVGKKVIKRQFTDIA